jgi:hypothetical protein
MRKLLVLSLLCASAVAQEPPATAPAPQLDQLQKDYEQIREALFSARARSGAAASALYNAKVQVYLKFNAPRFFHVSRATVRVDGGAVFDDTTGAIGTDNVLRWEGFVAPGKHQVGVRIDAETKDDPSFTTSTESTFTVDVPARKLVVLKAQADDAGDMGYGFPKKQKGSYKLRLDVGAEAKGIDEGGRR